jgi:hypothetical protein
MPPSLRHTLAICLLGVLSCGCIINRDISRNPSRYTDFLVGSVYQLKREVWITKESEATAYLSGTRPTAQKLEAGVRLQVTAIHYRSSPNFGRITHAYGKIIGENSVNQPLGLIWISKKDFKTGTTWVDPEYLELVTDETEN